MPDAIEAIAAYHNDTVSSLRLYFSNRSPNFNERFLGYSPDEVGRELKERLEETDRRSALAVMFSLERVFRADYDYRCQRKMKGDLARAFRAIHKSREHARLDKDIFEAWKQNFAQARQLIGELRGALRFRNFHAHGSYGEPKLGRKYDFDSIYDLANNVLNTFDFVGPD